MDNLGSNPKTSPREPQSSDLGSKLTDDEKKAVKDAVAAEKRSSGDDGKDRAIESGVSGLSGVVSEEGEGESEGPGSKMSRAETTSIIDSIGASDERMANDATFSRPGVKTGKRKRNKPQVKRFSEMLSEEGEQEQEGSGGKGNSSTNSRLSPHGSFDQIDFDNPLVDKKPASSAGFAMAAVAGRSQLKTTGMKKTASGRYVKETPSESTELVTSADGGEKLGGEKEKNGKGIGTRTAKDAVADAKQALLACCVIC